MANLFIGFPVSRAKIADMIASDAISSPYHYNGFYFYTLFESLDGWLIYKEGAEELTLSHQYLHIKTLSVQDSLIRLTRSLSYPFSKPLWSKTRHFRLRVRYDFQSLGFGDTHILIGALAVADPWANCFGFHIDGTQIKTRTSLYNTGQTETFVKDIMDLDDSNNFTLESKFTPGEKCEFNIDGVSMPEITTNLPSGDNNETVIPYIRLATEFDDPDYLWTQLRISEFVFYQEL